jgi:hypothetical protein
VRDGAANPTRRAGYQRRHAAEIEHCVPLCSLKPPGPI